ncbi:MAG: DMT family transporter [Paracoccaceae bacterium]
MSHAASNVAGPDRTLAGILFMAGFAATAPIMDSFAKMTPAEVPILQIVLVRFGFQVVTLLPLAWALGLAQRPGPREAWLHLVRGALLLTGTALFFGAIRFMPIANGLAIFFVSPFILTLAGALFLNEEVGWRRLMACAAGFAGALLVIRPSFADLGAVALMPLGTACCFAAYMVMTRSMAQRMHPIALQAWTAVAATLIVAPVLMAFNGSGLPALDPVPPSGTAVWTLLGVGVMATISHLFISQALKLAPAATLAPLQYLEIVAATILGYWLFGDFPAPLTWAGIAIIVGSGLYVIARERRLSRQPHPTPPA